MATRSRTVLFLQYRQSFARTIKRPPTTGGYYELSESVGLLGGTQVSTNETVVEMSMLPPRWIDIVKEIEDDLTKLKERIASLEQNHKKHLLPGFEDNFNDEEVIERNTSDITRKMADVQRKIKKIEKSTQSPGAVMTPAQTKLGKNIQLSLAQKLHDISTVFRKEQSSYLQKLRGRESKTGNFFGVTDGGLDFNDENYNFETGFTDQQLSQITNNDRAISEREKAINGIVTSIQSVATVFQELNQMVIDQGTILDRIDYNIDMVATNVEEAVKELDKGAKYQKRGQTRMIIMILLVGICVAIVVLVFRRQKQP